MSFESNFFSVVIDAAFDVGVAGVDAVVDVVIVVRDNVVDSPLGGKADTQNPVAT